MKRTVKRTLEGLAGRPSVRAVFTVASGTVVAQAVGMAFAPFITRLYGPAAFGLQGLFLSIVSVLSSVAALGYPTAIVLPRSDSDARGLVKLSIVVGCAMVLLTTVVLWFAGPSLLQLLNAGAISAFLFLIPVAMAVAVLASVLGQWLIRKKAYGITARFAVFTALLVGAGKTGMGLLAPSAMTLIITNAAGSLLGTALAFLKWSQLAKWSDAEKWREAPVASLGQLAARHKDFPLLRTPQNLINAFSQSLPVLLLASYFGPEASGHYTIAIAVLGLPASLIGNAVIAVFYPRVTEAVHNGENARVLIIRATLGMAAAGVLPFLLVIAAGPMWFALGFGQEWRPAGAYAQWLAGWLFLQFINKPAVSAIPSLHLQGGLLVYEAFSAAAKAFALWVGFAVIGTSVASVALFSVSGIVTYSWLILWVVYRSGQKDPKAHWQ